MLWLLFPSDILRDCLVMVVSITDIYSSLCSLWFYKKSSFCKTTTFAFISLAELPLAA